jgi:hypothetical protein
MKIYFKFLNNSFENLILYQENGKKNKGPKKIKLSFELFNGLVLTILSHKLVGYH